MLEQLELSLVSYKFPFSNKWTTKIDWIYQGTIYQPLRSGRIWHKVNF